MKKGKRAPSSATVAKTSFVQAPKSKESIT
jgi:hypothetical protein